MTTSIAIVSWDAQGIAIQDADQPGGFKFGFAKPQYFRSGFVKLLTEVKNKNTDIIILSTGNDVSSGTYVHSNIAPRILVGTKIAPGYTLLFRDSDINWTGTDGVSRTFRISVYIRDNVVNNIRLERSLNAIVCPNAPGGAVFFTLYFENKGSVTFANIFLALPKQIASTQLQTDLIHPEAGIEVAYTSNNECYRSLIQKINTFQYSSHLVVFGDVNFARVGNIDYFLDRYRVGDPVQIYKENCTIGNVKTVCDRLLVYNNNLLVNKVDAGNDIETQAPYTRDVFAPNVNTRDVVTYIIKF